MKGVVLAGTASGVGKTVATLTVCRALDQAGYDVQPAKAGPDYIDPSHHTAVTGKPSRTLDVWLGGEDGVRRNYHRGEGDICVVEGVMGLYDGTVASTADVAAALELPVVLVVDASAGMESVAATALGFREYAAYTGADIDVHKSQSDTLAKQNAERSVDVVGVLAQRAHGGRHEAGIRNALPDNLAYLGRIPPLPDLAIPERHLGLEMGDESPVDADALDEAAESIRVQQLIDSARKPPAVKPSPKRPKREKTVAVARDEVFRFIYPAVLEALRERIHVETFAPTMGDDLPQCDGVYLPGGYPELHATALSESPALETLNERASEELPILGECGGLMALAESLTTTDGETYEMASILPADVRMHERYQALNHVELRARTDTLTATAGETRCGHEFHYSSADVASDARFAFEVAHGSGISEKQDGLTEYSTLGTYCHLHAQSRAFDTFIDRL